MAVRTRAIEFIRDLPVANRPGKIISALTEAYPHSLSAKTLMEEMGLPWQVEPVPSFVSLCIDFQGINRGLRAYGWQAVRSSGSPSGQYRLSPLGAG
ncbi:hypothetical protein [Rhizobium rhizogenes]|jgi:hypothetical protein|uniref:hypothetical protein n=1 Tax=Rhizobium rhizogenes TaxID=359 RepID=UPI001572C060|nr:hypothetical protein [Rhizobium rhizogenes]NTF67943.1 hypothetical protein [Rhizobium rhizogenes]